jgi:hypothetical protein
LNRFFNSGKLQVLDAVVIILAVILNPRANRRRRRAAELVLAGHEPSLTVETRPVGAVLAAGGWVVAADDDWAEDMFAKKAGLVWVVWKIASHSIMGGSVIVVPSTGGSLRDAIPFGVHRILCGERSKL